jgi:hypothetical protein
MATPRIVLWIDSSNNNTLSGWQSLSGGIIPPFKQGDAVAIELHMVTPLNGAIIEEVPFDVGANIKLALGSVDTKPTSGSFILTFGANSVEIPITSTAIEAGVLINSLASITAAGGVSVSLVNGNSYRVAFNNVGVRSLITCNAQDLRPSASVLVRRATTGSSTSKEVQYIKAKNIPIAFCDTFSPVAAPVTSTTAVSAAITRFSISPKPKYGSFLVSNGTLSTGPISINATATEFLAALTESGISNENRIYSVLKVGGHDWDVSRLTGSSETLTVSSNGVVGFDARVGILNLNTAEVEDFLAGALTATCTLEVEVDTAGVKHTILQKDVTIRNDLIDESTYEPIALSTPASQASIDALEVRVAAMEDEFTIDTTSPTNNQVLAYNSVTGKWENKDTLNTFDLIDGGNY